MGKHSVTYMIVTCNRGEFLAKNISEQILSEHFDLEGLDFEIVIIDDGSTDGTFGRIENLCNGTLGIPLTYINVKRRQGSYYYSDSTIINTGVLKSHGEFVYIASSDCYICHPEVFQLLTKLEANSYMSPHMIRFDQATSDLYKFCCNNWNKPDKCMEHYRNFKTRWGAAYYDRIFGTGLLGLKKKTFCDAKGVPELKGHGYVGGTDAAMESALGAIGALNIDEAASDILVIHFPVQYAVELSGDVPTYISGHYTQVDGMTVVKDEYLEIHNLTL